MRNKVVCVVASKWHTMKYLNTIEPVNYSGMEDIQVEIDSMNKHNRYFR